jgi:hypothetical protein
VVDEALTVQRRCPRPIPSFSACWRSAPTVRFICFEIFATGVLAFECFRSSACIALVQAAPRGPIFFVVSLAICHSQICAGFYHALLGEC